MTDVGVEGQLGQNKRKSLSRLLLYGCFILSYHPSIPLHSPLLYRVTQDYTSCIFLW